MMMCTDHGADGCGPQLLNLLDVLWWCSVADCMLAKIRNCPKKWVAGI